MTIALIAAMGTNRAIGFGNKLPWYLPDDLKRFKAITSGHPVIMGRKTYESIGRPLPNRANFVVTKNSQFQAQGCTVCSSIEEAIELAKKIDSQEIFIIGGSEIYALGLPYANKMYLTFVDTAPDGDVYFPEFNEKEWEVVSSETHEQDDKHPWSFEFKELVRI